MSRDVTKFFFLSVHNLDLGIAYCEVLKVTPGIDRSSTMSGATDPLPHFLGCSVNQCCLTPLFHGLFTFMDAECISMVVFLRVNVPSALEYSYGGLGSGGAHPGSS